jgi:hypothetical protein
MALIHVANIQPSIHRRSITVLRSSHILRSCASNVALTLTSTIPVTLSNVPITSIGFFVLILFVKSLSDDNERSVVLVDPTSASGGGVPHNPCSFSGFWNDVRRM